MHSEDSFNLKYWIPFTEIWLEFRMIMFLICSYFQVLKSHSLVTSDNHLGFLKLDFMPRIRF